MTARRVKQVIYGVFYLALLAGIGTAIYFGFFHVAPSCFDNAQDQGELGVDCGGPCTKVCTSQTQDLIVGDFKTFTSSPGHYTFLARVENHNGEYAARSFGYSFNLYDASGTALRSFPGTSFIYASEVKYLALPNVGGAGSFDHAGLVVQTPEWVSATSMGPIPQFGNPLTLTANTVSSSTVTVSGQITNSDISSFAPVYLVAIFYDVNGIPAGASHAQLDAIAPNQTEPFSVSYPAFANVNPALTKVYAYALRP